MTLAQAEKGEKLIICSINDSEMRMKAIRFGIMEGAEVICAGKLPSGPVIIRKGRQELAVGRGLAQNIAVERIAGAQHRRRHGHLYGRFSNL
jgi:ferrous iron transport protein A